MTDKKLVEALRCCVGQDCSHCPAEQERNEVYPTCSDSVLFQAAGRIERAANMSCMSCWMHERCVITPMLGEGGFCSAWEAVKAEYNRRF